MKNKKSLLFIVSLVIGNLCYCMDMPQQNMTYEEFKLTRPYGKMIFLWDLLPQDIIEQHIRPHIANIIIAKFQQRLLHCKQQLKEQYENLETLPILPAHSSKDTLFHHHDGTYTIIADIGSDYVMCDQSVSTSTTSTRSFRGLPIQSLVLILTNTSQEKPITVSSPMTEFKLNDKKNFYIEVDEKTTKHEFKSKINHLAMSHDSTLICFGSEANDNSVTLISLDSMDFHVISCGGPITALCTAHHSPAFLVCTENDDTSLIMKNQRWNLVKQHNAIKTMPTSALFSPDDKQCITYRKDTFTVWGFHTPLSNEKTKAYNYHTATLHKGIQKALFTPDSKLIIFAMEDGQFVFYNAINHQFITQYYARWCVQRRIDNPMPLVICSPKSKLLFSVDPAKYDEYCSTVTIRKSSGKFDFLAACTIYPHTPCIIGLTKDEKSLILTDIYDASLRLDLYTHQDLNEIEFISKKANLYQLCEMLQLCKEMKKNKFDGKSKIFVDAMRQYIQNIAD